VLVPVGVVEVVGEDVVDVDEDVDVLGGAGVVDDVPPALVDVELDAGGFVSSPLDCSALSISCCTVATWEATAAGVPLAPSEGSAFSCCRSALSVASSCREGWAFSVTTIWSASAVVTQAGHW